MLINCKVPIVKKIYTFITQCYYLILFCMQIGLSLCKQLF